MNIVKNAELPYYAVITTLIRAKVDHDQYYSIFDVLYKKAQEIDGFLGMDSIRDGIGITVTYWKTIEAIEKWKDDADHLIAKKMAITKWYKQYTTRICKVEKHNQSKSLFN